MFKIPQERRNIENMLKSYQPLNYNRLDGGGGMKKNPNPSRTNQTLEIKY